MSLGVLNNLSAVYAENNVNNTNNELSKTLQQLSSGSRINSGADDAAGLSLVDGLEANQTALNQSQTNASEGVGLLQVADGALSQVTSLLNRAVTLATEASNGTLNSSQDAAANQEYQSILSEISNIGSTTTYNQNQVFGTTTNIYAGDSSASGASIDSLNIRSLSSSNVGDADGVMSYQSSGSAGTGDVFLNTGTTTDTGTSAFNAAAKSITISYLTNSGATATKVLNTTAGETLSSVASEITNAGLGLTATVTLAGVAGDAGAASQKDVGIEITGSIGTGTVSAASYQGNLSAGSTSAVGDTLSGSITLQTGTNAAQTITMADVNATEGTSTITALENYINGDTGLGVTASVDPTNAYQLDLVSTAGSTSALNVGSNLTDTTAGTAMSYTATAAYSNAITATSSTETIEAGAATSTAATATINYSDTAGVSLSGTDLNDENDAQAALNDLNSAISDVAAQDGYIGAMINTLNAVSNVLSTQSENVQSAQNAVQATDYAQASSNMSKYEILSQTGIAALAQANSSQQEVLKLLQ